MLETRWIADLRETVNRAGGGPTRRRRGRNPDKRRHHTAETIRHLDHIRDLTVITNALNIVSLLAPYQHIKTVITGGVLRNSELSMLGVLTEDALHNLRADKLFMSSPAIHVDYGFSADDMTEVESDRNMMSSAQEITVLADHTKFGKIAMCASPR